MLYYEKKARRQGYDLIAGVDEAGRGPLAGPVVAAAVVLGSKRYRWRIDDSKKLSALMRHKAFLEITGNSPYGVGIVNENIIDRVNILVATTMAMEEAIAALMRKLPRQEPCSVHLLVDGPVKLNVRQSVTNIIKGDAKSKTIAAASIIAKVIRDRLMCIYDKIYPQYGFAKHKGYPTSLHREMVAQFGPSLIHRKTFCRG